MRAERGKIIFKKRIKCGSLLLSHFRTSYTDILRNYGTAKSIGDYSGEQNRILK